MIEENYHREERLPLTMYYDAWLLKMERERKLQEAKKKFNNINWDKLL